MTVKLYEYSRSNKVTLYVTFEEEVTLIMKPNIDKLNRTDIYGLPKYA